MSDMSISMRTVSAKSGKGVKRPSSIRNMIVYETFTGSCARSRAQAATASTSGARHGAVIVVTSPGGAPTVALVRPWRQGAIDEWKT